MAFAKNCPSLITNELGEDEYGAITMTLSRVLPFPFPLRVGTDICQISRVHRIMCGPHAAKFVERVLAPEERVRPALRESVAWILSRQDGMSRGSNGKIRANSDAVGSGAEEVTKSDSRFLNAAQFMAGR